MKEPRHLSHNNITAIEVAIPRVHVHKDQGHLNGILVRLFGDGLVLVEKEGNEKRVDEMVPLLM